MFSLQLIKKKVEIRKKFEYKQNMILTAEYDFDSKVWRFRKKIKTILTFMLLRRIEGMID